VTVSNGRVLAVGSYEKKLLSSLAALFSGIAPSSALERYHVEYEGTLRGRAIEATVSRTREGVAQPSTPTSLLASGADEPKCLLFFTSSGSELKVMENPRGSTPNYYSLVAINDAIAADSAGRS